MSATGMPLAPPCHEIDPDAGDVGGARLADRALEVRHQFSSRSEGKAHGSRIRQESFAGAAGRQGPPGGLDDPAEQGLPGGLGELEFWVPRDTEHLAGAILDGLRQAVGGARITASPAPSSATPWWCSVVTAIVRTPSTSSSSVPAPTSTGCRTSMPPSWSTSVSEVRDEPARRRQRSAAASRGRCRGSAGRRCRGVEHRELPGVAVLVQPPHLGPHLGAVPRRVHVGTAGQHQRVESLDLARRVLGLRRRAGSAARRPPPRSP